ncbi:MAG: nucleotide exchange factor GrpE [Deltaproteobacteria bacterium]|jgi:molecular chaperone GrpE|nr:nucleotide exchange factor GrpE [Deltaproteobacteria bacterium]
MTSNPERPKSGKEPGSDPAAEPSAGWEALAEEASAGSLAPSAELEEALREAAEAVETRGARKGGRSPKAQEAAQELEALRGEFEAVKDRYIRLQADFENHRRRTLKERQEALQYGHENLVKDLLEAVDNLDRAIEHASRAGGDFEGMLQGVELVRRDLLGALAKHGVNGIEAEGAAFDPNLHEAMAQEEDDTVQPGTVVRVFQKGYQLRDRLLRPARVVVSKKSEAGRAEEPGEGAPKSSGQEGSGGEEGEEAET